MDQQQESLTPTQKRIDQEIKKQCDEVNQTLRDSLYWALENDFSYRPSDAHDPNVRAVAKEVFYTYIYIDKSWKPYPADNVAGILALKNNKAIMQAFHYGNYSYGDQHWSDTQPSAIKILEQSEFNKTNVKALVDKIISRKTEFLRPDIAQAVKEETNKTTTDRYAQETILAWFTNKHLEKRRLKASSGDRCVDFDEGDPFIYRQPPVIKVLSTIIKLSDE